MFQADDWEVDDAHLQKTVGVRLEPINHPLFDVLSTKEWLLNNFCIHHLSSLRQAQGGV